MGLLRLGLGSVLSLRFFRSTPYVGIHSSSSRMYLELSTTIPKKKVAQCTLNFRKMWLLMIQTQKYSAVHGHYSAKLASAICIKSDFKILEPSQKPAAIRLAYQHPSHRATAYEYRDKQKEEQHDSRSRIRARGASVRRHILCRLNDNSKQQHQRLSHWLPPSSLQCHQWPAAQQLLYYHHHQ